MEEEEEEVQVSGYKITKTLGKGTFGKVKIAIHKATQQKVAVKILEKQLIKDPSDVERISREIKILKKVYHPFIITLYEIVETQNRLYLFMQYANEGDLFSKIYNEKKLKENVAASYYLQLLTGLKYLHQQGITHRDLKPENLLLQNNQIKIADFGLGNFFQPNLQLKTACGSPCYAAPEMISKLSYDPPQVDAWSSGIVLYAMIMGYLPFQDTNVQNLYSKIKKGQFKIPGWVSPHLKQLLKGVLNVNPTNRLSIDQLIHHPWIKMFHSSIQIAPPIKIEPQLINAVALLYKLNKEKLSKALATKKHNSLTTIYYLAMKKQARAVGLKPQPRSDPLPQIKQQKRHIQSDTKPIEEINTERQENQEKLQSTKQTVKQSKVQQPAFTKQQNTLQLTPKKTQNIKITSQQKQPSHPKENQKEEQKKQAPSLKQNLQKVPKHISKFLKPSKQVKPIFIQQQLNVQLEVIKGKQLDITMPLRKGGRMEIKNMKKTATRLYERSGSRETEVSIRLTAAKKSKLLLKRIQKKPRLLSSGFFFKGHVEQLRDLVKNVEPKNPSITVEYYQIRPDFYYIVKTNMQVINLKNALLQRIEKND